MLLFYVNDNKKLKNRNILFYCTPFSACPVLGVGWIKKAGVEMGLAELGMECFWLWGWRWVRLMGGGGLPERLKITLAQTTT